jgi:polar amino acid transport system substrate-binding protein
VKLSIIFILCIFSFSTTSKETLRVVTENLPPYQIVKNNKLVAGTSYLIMKNVLKRAGFTSKIEVLPWARAYHTALNDKNVIIFSITRSVEREHQFHWLGTLRELKYRFYSLKSKKSIELNSVKEALNYKAVAVRDSFEADSLVKLGFISGDNLTLTVGYIEAWNMLLKGRADITYANVFIGDTIHKTLSFENTPFLKHGFTVEEYTLYVAASINTSNAILTKITAALNSLKADGTFTKILSAKEVQ